MILLSLDREEWTGQLSLVAWSHAMIPRDEHI